MDTIRKTRRRRASFGFSAVLQAKVRPETRDKVQKLAEVLEVAEGQIVRDALEAYDLDAHLARARSASRMRRQREAAKDREGEA